MINVPVRFIKLTSITKLRFASFAAGLSCLFLFQNCENFGSFVAYDELSSEDPHKGSWRPVDGLVVKDGEWVKVEEKIEEKLRLTDRHFIASKLSSIGIHGDDTSEDNKVINYRINASVRRFVDYFGGSCIYTNPESISISPTAVFSCSGLDPEDVSADLIPSPNVFRSVLKSSICDYFASNLKVQKNIEGNLELISALKESDHIPYLVHQLFYLGQEPSKRTLASLEDLYKKASASVTQSTTVLNSEGLKFLTLAVCHSNGWESP